MNILYIEFWRDIPKNYTGIVEYTDSTLGYYLNGKYHREDGPAVIDHDGSMCYYLNGKYHREDGPAVIDHDGTIYYYLNDLRHREDGPAVIYPDGKKEWYLNNVYTTKEVNKWIKENNIPDYKLWNNSDKILFKLTFG